MADRRDDVDDWLSGRIEPLPPPPGTFDLIKRRARRRKFRKLAITASSAAVLVAAAVTVPQVVNLPVLSQNPTPGVAAKAGQSSSATPSESSSRGTASAAASGAAQIPTVPPDFRPTSVTFVGLKTGWVIGQAASPGHCATQYCTSMARTNDAGGTWTGVPAPLAGAPDGASGLNQVRFLNLTNGWAFGPQLFETHTGGLTWAPVDTGGMRVTDLETVGDRVFALWASCTGTGPAYGAQCTSFTLYSAPADGGGWTRVGAATTGLTDGAAHEAASLLLTRTFGYLLAPDGTLYSGPVDGSAAWTRTGSLVAGCTPGAPRGDGQPGGALLGAGGAGELILACVSDSSGGSPSVSAQQKLIYSSPNGGASWLPMAKAPEAGVAFSLAASPSGSVVLGTDQGIDVLPHGDIAWQQATLAGTAQAGSGGGPAGGFGYVGMTSDDQGVALPADPSGGTVWFTFNGGQTWKASFLNGS